MNTPQDDGGPAFASPGMPAYSPDVAALNRWAGYGWAHDPQPGMSLRDWFAGMALSGLIERDTKMAIHELSKADHEPAAPILYRDGSAYTDLTNEAYIIAAEMLVARKEQP